MLGDIQISGEAAFGYPGDASQQVLAGAVATINAAEPVTKALGQQYVVPAVTGTPVVGTDFMAGISATASSDTVALDGVVQVTKLVPGTVYLGNPLIPGNFATQANYNARVGRRVLFDLTAGKYTISDVDGATFGLVIENLDISKTPGKVAFSIREAVSYQA